MEWFAFPAQPKEYGSYIVAHRGTQKVIKFLPSPTDRIPSVGTKYGWQEDPREFGATHWAPIEEVPEKTTPRQMMRALPIGAEVRFTVGHTFELNYSPERAHKKAVWCWEKWGWYREPYLKYKTRRWTAEIGDTGVVIESGTGKNTLEKVYKIQIGTDAECGFVKCSRVSGYPFTPVNSAFFTNAENQGINRFVDGSGLLLK